MTQKKNRSKLSRYDPELMQALRDAIETADPPAQLLKDGQSNGDLVDLALRLAHSYFSGALVESFRVGAKVELEKLMRQTVLVVAASFGATATFTADGGVTMTMVRAAEGDTWTAAVQALVDTGLTVADAVDLLATSPSPPQGRSSFPIKTPINTELSLDMSATKH